MYYPIQCCKNLYEAGCRICKTVLYVKEIKKCLFFYSSQMLEFIFFERYFTCSVQDKLWSTKTPKTFSQRTLPRNDLQILDLSQHFPFYAVSEMLLSTFI